MLDVIACRDTLNWALHTHVRNQKIGFHGMTRGVPGIVWVDELCGVLRHFESTLMSSATLSRNVELLFTIASQATLCIGTDRSIGSREAQWARDVLGASAAQNNNDVCLAAWTYRVCPSTSPCASRACGILADLSFRSRSSC